MRIRFPVHWLLESHQNRVFVILLVLTIGLLLCMNLVNEPLKTTAAPNGIISFEFAGKISVAQEMIQSWDLKGQIYAGLSLGLDYLFLFLYSLTIALGCVIVTRSLSQSGQLLYCCGMLLAWLQFGAAFLDSIENYALIKILLGSQQDLLSVLAYWCALFKFLIVMIGIAYILIGFVFVFIRKLKSRKSLKIL